MDILLWIVIIIGGGTGLFSCLYIVVSLFGTIGYKFYRKFKYHMSLYDWWAIVQSNGWKGEVNMDFGNILVIFMCVVVVGVGLYSFLSEYVLNKETDVEEKVEKQD